MELDCDLSLINSEDLLRKMWQQSEDDHRRKDIRSHLYKLREARLRNLYQGEIMSGNSGPGFGKDPMTPSHGDALVDQSFQSLKSKEIRDSISPTHDMKFHSLSLNHPNSTGWDVQTSSEVSPDGRAYRTETVAKTDGVEKVQGGLAEFKGRNEQKSSASHQGDDKNFVKKASESSNTHLQEKVVVGDENSGRTEMKMSSTTSSSSSQVMQSSSTVEHDGIPQPNAPRYLMDNTSQQHVRNQHEQQQQQQQQQHYQQQQQLQREQERRIQDQLSTQQHQQQYTEEYNRNRQETSSSTNVETQKSHEQNKRYVDMDKATPEYQQHVQDLMAQPGEIISNIVEYPKPNVKMITTVKRLPDGTIVKNKRYETEELTPTAESTNYRNTSTTNRSNNQQTTQRRTQDEQHRTHTDVVDNVDTTQRNQERNVQQQPLESYQKDRYTDEAVNTAATFSSTKKSSRRFSTETTSETIEEHDDHGAASRPNTHPIQDFSTHGFPSVKPNKPTREYPTDRAQAPKHPNDFSTHGFPSVKPNKTTQEYPTDRPHPTRSTDVHHVIEQTIAELNTAPDFTTHGFPSVKTTKTVDGDVVIVSSEKTHSVKQKSNSERIIETQVTDSDYPQAITHGYPSAPGQGTPGQGSPRKSQPIDDFSTHGFPAVRSPGKTQPDFSTHGFPSAREPGTRPGQLTKPSTTIDGDVLIVSSQTKQTSNQKSNREHIIETKVIGDDGYPTSAPQHYTEQITHTTDDFSTHGYPSVKGYSPQRDTPSRDYPSGTRSTQPNENYSSPRSPTKPTDYSTHGFPSARETNRSPTKAKPTSTTTKPMAPTTKKTINTETTKKLLQKEKEVDASHRAFAASLRSSSPVDSTRRDSTSSDHQRQTPRSSVSSTRTFRRDMREGSHDSAAPSETSRISSNTVTRQSPGKSVGKTVVTKQTAVKTRSNDTIDLTPQRSTKSPSPGKTITTTTTRTTTTTKKPPTPTSTPTPTATTTTTRITSTTEVPKPGTK